MSLLCSIECKYLPCTHTHRHTQSQTCAPVRVCLLASFIIRGTCFIRRWNKPKNKTGSKDSPSSGSSLSAILSTQQVQKIDLQRGGKIRKWKLENWVALRKGRLTTKLRAAKTRPWRQRFMMLSSMHTRTTLTSCIAPFAPPAPKLQNH